MILESYIWDTQYWKGLAVPGVVALMAAVL